MITYAGAEWLVEHARLGGGGTGHGPHDIFPDGWMLTLRRLKANGAYDPKGEEIQRFQSGSFSEEHMLREATVVRRMRKTWLHDSDGKGA